MGTLFQQLRQPAVTPQPLINDEKIEEQETTHELNNQLEAVHQLNELRKALDDDTGLEADSPIVLAHMSILKSKFNINLEEEGSEEVSAGEAKASLKERITKKIKGIFESIDDWVKVEKGKVQKFNIKFFQGAAKEWADTPDQAREAIVRRINKKKSAFIPQNGALPDLTKAVAEVKSFNAKALNGVAKFRQAIVDGVAKAGNDLNEEKVAEILKAAQAASKIDTLSFEAPGFHVDLDTRSKVMRGIKWVINQVRGKQQYLFNVNSATVGKFLDSASPAYKDYVNLLNSVDKSFKQIVEPITSLAKKEEVLADYKKTATLIEAYIAVERVARITLGSLSYPNNLFQYVWVKVASDLDIIAKSAEWNVNTSIAKKNS